MLTYTANFWATVCKTVRPMLSDRCLSSHVCLSLLSVTLVYCGQMVGWIKMSLGREVVVSPCDIVLDGDAAPPPQRGRSPQFSAHVYCGQTAEWIKMPRYGIRPQPRPHYVRQGPSSPSPRERARHIPPFGPCLLWSRSPISATAELL